MVKERKRMVVGRGFGGAVSWDDVVLIWNPAWCCVTEMLYPFPPTSRLPPGWPQLTCPHRV